ncbi:hypothetical protein BU15DRAFT_65374 [Melanogaster broomeanus]|nr:hypothetical protein BU15DRAFT_65374 [Melanogaster broomeanus]
MTIFLLEETKIRPKLEFDQYECICAASTTKLYDQGTSSRQLPVKQGVAKLCSEGSLVHFSDWTVWRLATPTLPSDAARYCLHARLPFSHWTRALPGAPIYHARGLRAEARTWCQDRLPVAAASRGVLSGQQIHNTSWKLEVGSRERERERGTGQGDRDDGCTLDIQWWRGFEIGHESVVEIWRGEEFHNAPRDLVWCVAMVTVMLVGMGGNSERGLPFSCAAFKGNTKCKGHFAESMLKVHVMWSHGASIMALATMVRRTLRRHREREFHAPSHQIRQQFYRQNTAVVDKEALQALIGIPSPARANERP